MENHRNFRRFNKIKRERIISKKSTYPLCSRTGWFSWYLCVFLPLLLLTIPCINAQICQPVFPPTLSRLHEILDDAGSYKVLCQFHISKDKGECDVKDAYKIKSVMNLVCRPEYGSSGKCVIDCPNTHFQIEPSAIAQFSGFEFRSATTSSIQVLPHGVFYSRNNVFVGNASKEKGGAIYAQPNSGTSIVFTTFESNYAPEGGAIYIGNKGVNVYTASTLLGNTFAVNYADVGGAMYIDERVKLTLIKNTFYGNYIDLESGLGPAIYYAGFLAKYCYGNYGCDNGRTLCDGGWNAAIQKCEPFETVCTYNPPTKEPTSTTGSPTRIPTLTPTLHPTMAPTNSNLPSIEPTISPSKFPSPIPTVTESNAPSFSNEPSQHHIPTPTPSSIPSISPSNKPIAAESRSPSDNPTKLHSEEPSYSNMPTQSLSDSPSAVRKNRKL